MITISLIWINVVISGFIVVSEYELWGMMVSLNLSHSPRERCGFASFSSSIFIPFFTQWPSQNGLHPSPFLSFMSAASKIYICYLCLCHSEYTLKLEALCAVSILSTILLGIMHVYCWWMRRLIRILDCKLSINTGNCWPAFCLKVAKYWIHYTSLLNVSSYLCYCVNIDQRHDSVTQSAAHPRSESPVSPHAQSAPLGWTWFDDLIFVPCWK